MMLTVRLLPAMLVQLCIIMVASVSVKLFWMAAIVRKPAGGRQMIIPIIVSKIFVLAVVVLCLAKPNTGRIFRGLFFLVMAIGVNITTCLEILRSKLRPQ